jgi:hypothetical protein
MTLATQFLYHLPFAGIPCVNFSDKGTSMTRNIYLSGLVTWSKMAASISAKVVADKSANGKGGVFVVNVHVKIVILIRLMTLVPTVQCLSTSVVWPVLIVMWMNYLKVRQTCDWWTTEANKPANVLHRNSRGFHKCKSLQLGAIEQFIRAVLVETIANLNMCVLLL